MTRRATGRGPRVDVNLVDSVFSLMEGMLPEYAMDGRVRQPVGAAIATAAPTNTYPCADGQVAVHRRQLRPDLRRLMAAIGRPELARGPALRHQRRPLRADRDELDAAIAAWTRTLPREGRRGGPGGGGGAMLAAVRHRRLRARPAFPGARVGAGRWTIR